MITRRKLLRTSAAAVALAGAPLHASRAAEFTLKWGHAMPATHPISIRGTEAIENIRKQTNGRVDIQMFPDNQLGGDNDMTAQVRAGGLELYTAAATSAGTLVPLVGIVTTAFAFPTSEQGWKAMDGNVGTLVADAFTSVNLYAFRKMWASGFRQMTSATKPISSPDDLVGFKMRVPTSPMLLSLFRALRASPTSMNVSELYSALQTKIVDGQENPLPIIATRNFNEVQKYCALTNHVWDIFIQTANVDAWKAIPLDLQQIVIRNFDEAAIKQRADIEQLTARLQGELEKKGMIFNQPDGNQFRDALRKAGFYAEWQKTFGDKAWAVLEEYSGKLT
jgi:tripartite ATP-independent transporter DctP family solute receptor